MKILLGIICIFLIYIAIEIYWETHSFIIKRYEVKTKKLPTDMKQKKIIFLSDFHNQEYGKNSEKLVEAIRKEQPDLILIGGDMVVGKKDIPCTNGLEFVKQLPSIAPVYYANGNHEQRMKERESWYGRKFLDYKEELDKYGIHFLMNEDVVLGEGEEKIRITGLEIPIACYKKFEKLPLYLADIEECIGHVKDGFQLLLAHHPAYAKTYWEWGADLVLSGHLHGGVVRIPFIGAVINPQYHLFPRYSGDYYKNGDKGIIVSRGLGMHTIKIRLWNRAEMVVFTLEGK